MDFIKRNYKVVFTYLIFVTFASSLITTISIYLGSNGLPPQAIQWTIFIMVAANIIMMGLKQSMSLSMKETYLYTSLFTFVGGVGLIAMSAATNQWALIALSVIASPLAIGYLFLYAVVSKRISSQLNQVEITALMQILKAVFNTGAAIAISGIIIFLSSGSALLFMGVLSVVVSLVVVIKTKRLGLGTQIRVIHDRVKDLDTHRNILFLSLSVALFNAGWTIFMATAPILIMGSFGSQSQAAAITPIYMVSMVVGGLVVSRCDLMDHIKAITTVSLILSSLFFGLAALSSSFIEFCLMLSIGGICSSVWNISALVYIKNAAGNTNTKMKSHQLMTEKVTLVVYFVFVVLAGWLPYSILLLAIFSMCVAFSIWFYQRVA